MDAKFEELYFPHDKIREIQDELILKISDAVKSKRNLIAHAPTGLGKTAAVIGPCLNEANKKDLTVYFLTSRHMQHKIVIETLQEIEKKYSLKLNAVSIIGKKWLCLQSGVEKLYSKEFAEYCRALKEDGKCDYYNNMKKKDKFSADTEVVLKNLKGISTTESIIEQGRERFLCPYEISLLLAKNAKVIITDYNYIFNASIRENFFKKSGKELEKSILIVDEAHNLPSRVKDLASSFLSSVMIKRAMAEAKKFNHDEIVHVLKEINEILENYSAEVTVRQKRITGFKTANEYGSNDADYIKFNEKYISKEDFVEKIERIKDYDELVSELTFIGDAVREEQKQSYIGSIAMFLEHWLGQDEGFARILSVKEGLKEPIILLSYRCLDPSLITKNILNRAYSCILMSGTLTPTSMYKELLGVENCDEATFKSPFPESNKLNIIIPKTSTKYETRNASQYNEIAKILGKIVNIVPGNTAVFFPSYYLKDEVNKTFNSVCEKTTFSEVPNMNKSEKQNFLEDFKKYSKTGAVLLGVIGGNFGEGIDLPGDFLKAVVIVGLPLQKPDLETKSLIEYYDKKFKKGWDYGYIFPAFTKAVQAAGRCIRSETDKGVIVFVDERYEWPKYKRCFPISWQIKTSLMYEKLIKDFFSK